MAIRFFTNRNRLLALVLGGAIGVALAGCANVSRYTLDTDFDSTPVKSTTKLTKALRCLGTQLNNVRETPTAYVFIVRDIVDGTVNQDYTDGPLADAGRIQMISILTAHTRPSYGVVTDEFPLMLKPTINEQVGLNRFGLPSSKNLDTYVSKLAEISNADRSATGMKAVDKVVPLIIDGAFTRYDSSHTRSRGFGENAGYRGDDTEQESLSIDRGDSGSERSVTLVVNIIDPKTNVVVGTEGFDLKFYNKSKTARFRVAIDEYYYGFSNTDVQVETVHAAQQTLLEAGAIWILDNAYGETVNFGPCFTDKETLALGQDVRYVQDEEGLGVPLIEQPPIPQESGEAVSPLQGQHAQEQKKAPLSPERTEKVDSRQVQQTQVQKKAPLPPKRTGKVSTVAGVGNDGSARGYHVRLGAYSKLENVNNVVGKLTQRGYLVHKTKIKIGAEPATRIWLGPYADREVAQELCDKLSIMLDEPGYVFHQK